MNSSDPIRVQYDELDDFTFPLLKIVCQPRGFNETWKVFEATCPSCNQRLNGEGLVMSASMNVMYGHLGTGKGGAAGCPNCGCKTLIAKLKGVTDEEFEALKKESNFSKIIGANTEQSCFIATACYGNSVCYEIQLLRQFRDKLITSSIGSLFVMFYYKWSPPIASYLEKHPSLANIVRIRILNPIVSLIR